MWGGRTIDKGVLECGGKGIHGAGAGIARVRVSAHTVWTWSSFPMPCRLPLLRKLLLHHTLLMPRSCPMHRSSLTCRSPPMRHHNSQMNHSFLLQNRLLMRRMLPVGYKLWAWCMSPGVQWLWWRLVCSLRPG